MVYYAMMRKEYFTTRRRGFTIIELLVVTAIFALMTSLVLANYPRFNAQIILENTAYEVALEVRQAQSFGLGVRETAVAADEFPGYGVYIPDITSENTRVFLYADGDGNKLYSDGTGCVPGTGECVEALLLRNYFIYAVCGNWRSDHPSEASFRTTSDVDPYVATGHCDIDTLDINFTRPNPDALLQGYASGIPGHPLSGYSDVEIVVATSDGNVRTVVVWSTGQIAVE